MVHNARILLSERRIMNAIHALIIITNYILHILYTRSAQFGYFDLQVVAILFTEFNGICSNYIIHKQFYRRFLYNIPYRFENDI